MRAKVDTRSGLEAIGYTLQDWKFDEAANNNEFSRARDTRASGADTRDSSISHSDKS